MSYSIFKIIVSLINIVGWIRYIFRFPFNLKMRGVLKDNLKLTENSKNGVCYLCGLGPSLSEVNLDNLIGEDVLVVNRFYRMADKTNLQPKYYLMVDNAVVEETHKDILATAVKTYPNSNFIFKTNFLTVNKKLKTEVKNSYYISSYKGYFSGNEELRIDKIMPALSNSVSVAIAFLMAIGYKKIVLLGCDFNSFASLKRVHCYDKNEKRYISISQELFGFSFVAYEHMCLAKYAKKHGIEVVNGTANSLIDAYPFEIDKTLYIAK